MSRFIIVFVLNTAAMVALTMLSGGVRGVATNAPDPHVDAQLEAPTSNERIVPPFPVPMAFHDAHGIWMSTEPEAVKVTDPETGRSVVIPDFERYHFEARESRPTKAEEKNHQAIEARSVRVFVYREPETLREAEALLAAEPGAKEALLLWRITAPVADAEFLQEGMSLRNRRRRPTLADTLIVLRGGVVIQNVQDEITISGEEIELEPGLGEARGRGHFEVAQPSLVLTGEGMQIKRTDASERVHLAKNVVVHLRRELKKEDGTPLLDLGGAAFRPGSVRADGGATILRDQAFGRDRLRIELEGGVHAEQEGGRTLDAERIEIRAHRPLVEAAGAKPTDEDWRLESFRAMGGVIVEYPDEMEDGSPFLLSLRGEMLIHEVQEDGAAITLLEGEPRIDFHGDVPLQDRASGRDIGLLRASAAHQAHVRLPGPGELPPGEDPSKYLCIELRERARLERRDTGLDKEWDRLEGTTLKMLMRKVEVLPDAAGGKTRERLVAVRFALRENVRLTGTRMSGMTHQLVGEGLDTDAPVLVAEGPNTSFAFHGLGRGERMLGGSTPSDTPESTNADRAAKEDEVWVLERLRASGGLVVRTRVGGSTVGLPARLEGAELAYDRVSDRARLQSAGSIRARVSIGDPTRPTNTIAARTMTLERGNGIIRASGDVRGTVYLQSDGSMQPGLDALGLGDAEVSDPVTFGVATNGRIEIRGVIDADERRPELDADQVILIEGGVVAELRSASTAVDDLRAETLEIALRRRTEEVDGNTTAPLARLAPRRDTPAPTEAPSTPPVLTRWDLEAGMVTARFGDQGLLGVEAERNARLVGEAGQIRGRRIAYDAKARLATVDGAPERQSWARAIFGADANRNEVWAPSIQLRLGARGPESLVAKGGAQAIFFRSEQTPGGRTWEKLEALFVKDVIVTQTELRSDGTVDFRRYTRTEAKPSWGVPGQLWADRITAYGRQFLDREAAIIDRVVASGPSTAFQIGAGDNRTTVWGDRFELEMKTQLATLTGLPGRPLEIRRGTEANPRLKSKQSRIVIDLKAGMIREAGRFSGNIGGSDR